MCAEYVPRPSGVFGGRATVRWPPPLAGPWKFFTGDFIWKGAFFAIFQQELQHSTMFDGYLRFQISEKWANLRFPLNIQKQKVFQLQLCPWTPVIGSRSACSPCPPLPNPKYATAIIAYSVNAVILFVSQINTQKQTDGQHRWADRVIDTYAYRQTEWTRRSLLW